MPPALEASETLERARAALRDGRGAGLPELLKLIETISTDVGKATVSEIADLVERDAAVLCRVLTVANTIVHNPNIAPLASITHAIHQIGFQRVRNLAVSLMLIENSDGSFNPPEQREAAARALCASLLAQSCAKALGSVDPELAFTCAALRQFGLIILPAVSIEHYRIAVDAAIDMPEDDAFRAQFGVTPIEVSRELLGFVRLSPEVTQSLRDCHPEIMGGTSATTLGSRLLGMVDLGGRMARLALDGDPEKFADDAKALAARFEKLLPGVGQSIETAVVETAEHIHTFSQHSSLGNWSTRGLRYLAAHARKISDDREEKSDAPVRRKAKPAPAARFEPRRRASNPPTTSSRAPAVDAHAEAVVRVREIFKCDECWLFEPAPAAGVFHLAHADGAQAAAVRARGVVNKSERTVFGICLARREHVLIHDTGMLSILPYLPDWLRAAPAFPGAFLLMPLMRGDACAGLVLVGWHRPQRIAVTPDQAEQARQVILAATPTEKRAA
ncbi:MAG TPA: HDOD domain-containing protein [Candidatus Didemnitutus sp.]|nr:HDOD domain-containing protein [Candidatus Didemnitutus sp.]